ncbi:sensor histidine kinase [Chryseolinea soli]|uniref:histidine kinase n=1 Tax=Chryseolinea soli TaxID=2321403 RepID=A0A385T1B9_9BACT|nr:ATP-binding protein [Chryseolinea soli]AYB34898.1 HAMP domain-containing protein [Chryseolinea soli]
MKIAHIILVSFFSILVLFSITTFINYQQYGLVNDNAERLERSTAIVRNSNRFQRNFLNMVSGLRGYLLTNETSFLQTYDSAVVENKDILSELNTLVPAGSDQKIILDDIRELQKYWISEFATPLLEAKKNADLSEKENQAFQKLYREKLLNKLEKDVQASLQRKFSDFTNYEYGYRISDRENLAHTVQNTKSISFYLTTISVILGTAIAIFIAHYISTRIVRMVKMANEIAGGNYAVYMPEKGNSELSQLTRALNNMASILGSQIAILKRQKEEVDQFAHIVSHDLKAPLRGIDNVVTWIEEDHSFDLPPKVNEYLKVIKGRIIRAENLLKGILMYARAGRETPDREVVDVNDVLAEIRGDLGSYNGITLEIQKPMPTLLTQRVPLVQVFSNLIVNAFKYHDKKNGVVNVSWREEGEHYHFFVSDNGPGIPALYHQKIFAIFQTLQERDTLESVGVGLAIVKKILDDRQLFINVTSEPGKGATFSFTWPKHEEHETSNPHPAHRR